MAERKAYTELHIAVLLFGLTAILGDLIEMSAMMIVWWRVVITCISLLFFVKAANIIRDIPPRLILQFMGIGVLVALHWLTFYEAIKMANASIVLVCLATSSFFTAVLEPFVMNQKVKWYEIILGLLVIPGMVLIVNSTDISMMTGFWIGLLSAFIAALFGALNKKLVGQSDEVSITFLELGSACVFISLAIPFYLPSMDIEQFIPSVKDWFYLLTLALLCTTVAYILALRALKYISAFAANLTVNLEPIYGIILACLILNEHKELNSGFYVGVVIIICSILSYPFLKRQFGQG
jgi:drug/metabolite transporter (DMT)-like permease